MLVGLFIVLNFGKKQNLSIHKFASSVGLLERDDVLY